MSIYSKFIFGGSSFLFPSFAGPKQEPKPKPISEPEQSAPMQDEEEEFKKELQRRIKMYSGSKSELKSEEPVSIKVIKRGVGNNKKVLKKETSLSTGNFINDSGGFEISGSNGKEPEFITDAKEISDLIEQLAIEDNKPEAEIFEELTSGFTWGDEKVDMQYSYLPSIIKGERVLTEPEKKYISELKAASKYSSVKMGMPPESLNIYKNRLSILQGKSEDYLKNAYAEIATELGIDANIVERIATNPGKKRGFYETISGGNVDKVDKIVEKFSEKLKSGITPVFGDNKYSRIAGGHFLMKRNPKYESEIKTRLNGEIGPGSFKIFELLANEEPDIKQFGSALGLTEDDKIKEKVNELRPKIDNILLETFETTEATPEKRAKIMAAIERAGLPHKEIEGYLEKAKGKLVIPADFKKEAEENFKKLEESKGGKKESLDNIKKLLKKVLDDSGFDKSKQLTHYLKIGNTGTHFEKAKTMLYNFDKIVQASENMRRLYEI